MLLTNSAHLSFISTKSPDPCMFAFAGYSSDPSPIITHATHAHAIKHPSTPPPTAIASNIASICIQ
jgi:hypothetical protein